MSARIKNNTKEQDESIINNHDNIVNMWNLHEVNKAKILQTQYALFSTFNGMQFKKSNLFLKLISPKTGYIMYQGFHKLRRVNKSSYFSPAILNNSNFCPA